MPRRRILSVGTDGQLLTARNSILAAAGYQVAVARYRHAAILALCSVRFDIVMLCWALPNDDRDKLTHDIEIVNPKVRVLRLEESEEATIAKPIDTLAAGGAEHNGASLPKVA